MSRGNSDYLRLYDVFIREATQLENNNKYIDARMYYREGIRYLGTAIRDEKKSSRKSLFQIMYDESYQRYQSLLTVRNEEATSQCISIKNDSTGHSYQSLFAQYLDDTVTNVNIQEPFLNAFPQYNNLVRFCELLVKNCSQLLRIYLRTKQIEDNSIRQKLQNLIKDLHINYKINLQIEYDDINDGLHYRRIELNNGWVFVLGRGLHFYKNINKGGVLNEIGRYDYDLRKCQKTDIDIIFEEVVTH